MPIGTIGLGTFDDHMAVELGEEGAVHSCRCESGCLGRACEAVKLGRGGGRLSAFAFFVKSRTLTGLRDRL